MKKIISDSIFFFKLLNYIDELGNTDIVDKLLQNINNKYNIPIPTDFNDRLTLVAAFEWLDEHCEINKK